MSLAVVAFIASAQLALAHEPPPPVAHHETVTGQKLYTHAGWPGDYDEHGAWHDRYWWMDNRPSYAHLQHPEWREDRPPSARENEREPGNVNPQ